MRGFCSTAIHILALSRAQYADVLPQNIPCLPAARHTPDIGPQKEKLQRRNRAENYGFHDYAITEFPISSDYSFFVRRLSHLAASASRSDYPFRQCTTVTRGTPDCSFTSYNQCQASISGVGGDCIRNPRFHSSPGKALEPPCLLRSTRPAHKRRPPG
ncbi:DUF3551 domain-containing protein [Tardiphaga sp.]|uniref:DUF3551 domain-containing protein n=1 Tax=Tardiphaga sp. TaxID=1926292 RepID=UPI0037DA3CFC